jgi:hypothetical protein
LPREEKRSSPAYAVAAAGNKRNLTRKIEWILAHALVEDLIGSELERCAQHEQVALDAFDVFELVHPAGVEVEMMLPIAFEKVTIGLTTGLFCFLTR